MKKPQVEAAASAIMNPEPREHTFVGNQFDCGCSKCNCDFWDSKLKRQPCPFTTPYPIPAPGEQGYEKCLGEALVEWQKVAQDGKCSINQVGAYVTEKQFYKWIKAATALDLWTIVVLARKEQ